MDGYNFTRDKTQQNVKELKRKKKKEGERDSEKRENG